MKRVLIFHLLVILLASCGNNTKTKRQNMVDSLDNPLTLLNEQLEKDPDNPNLLYERAQVYFDNKQIDPAMADIDRATLLDSSKANFFLLKSDIYYAVNKIDEAKRAIEKALELDPKNRDANVKMGELQYYLKDYQNAFDYLDEALRIDPYFAKTYFIKGMCFKESGDTGLAMSSFRTCVEQDPDYFHAWMQMGNIASVQHDPTAIDYYNNALTINGTMPEAYYGLAYFYQEHGEPDKALQVYNDLLLIDPKNAAAKHNIGYVYLFKMGDPGKSISFFTEATVDQPEYVQAYYHRGFAYEQLGNTDLAIKDYRKTLTIEPGFPFALKRLEALGVNP